jgi:hypothetical protein
LSIEAGDRLLVDIQDGLIILILDSEDFVAYLAGLRCEIRQGISTLIFLNEERVSWQESSNN